jgi:hypothetical protein
MISSDEECLFAISEYLSEKRTRQVIEKIEKTKKQMEGLESRVVIRRQTLQSLVDGLRYFFYGPASA